MAPRATYLLSLLYDSPESLSLSFLVDVAIGLAVADFFGTALWAVDPDPEPEPCFFPADKLFVFLLDFLSSESLSSVDEAVADEALRLRVTAPDFFAEFCFFLPDFCGDSVLELSVDEAVDRFERWDPCSGWKQTLERLVASIFKFYLGLRRGAIWRIILHAEEFWTSIVIFDTNRKQAFW